MSSQLDIFTIEKTGARKTPLQAAAAWVARNPEAWKHIKHEARWAAEHGRRFGMKCLVEQVRWNSTVVRGEKDVYRIDNRAISALSRLLTAECPEVADYVEQRACSLDNDARKGDRL